MSRIFAGNHISLLHAFNSAKGNVAKIADRGGDQLDDTWHGEWCHDRNAETSDSDRKPG
jgi:hypothetical protein